MAAAPERPAIPVQGMRPIQFAEWYVTVPRWSIFPLAYMSKEPLFRSPHPKGHTCRGECGKLGHGVYDATNDLETVRRWWTDHPNANIGLAVPEGHIAVDVDSNKGGLETLRALEQKHGALPETVTNLTGSGNHSAHYFLTVPAGTGRRGVLGKGIEVKHHPGGYLVVPPSLHPDTSQPYLWRSGYDPEDTGIAPAPPWLLDLLTHSNGHGSNDVPVDPQTPITDNRNIYLTAEAGKLRRSGFEGDEIYAALAVRNAAKCAPPLPDEEVRSISYGMERYQPEPELIVTTQAVPVGWQARPANEDKKKRPKKPAPKQPLADFDWYKEYIGPFVSRSGTIIANNTTLMAVLEKHPDFAATGDLPGATRQFWWDDFTSKVMRDDVEMTDTSITELGAELGSRYNLPVQSDALLNRCLIAVCQKYKRDPLQHYLQNLPGWDMTKRLDTWLLRCAGLTDPELESYHQFCSRNLIVSMIARAFDPGCICRSVLILEGPEEYRKSTFVAQLAPTPEWFDEISGSLDTKEAHMMVQGLWVAELSELDSLGRTEETRLKSFISLRVDAYIPKFKSMRVQPKRRTVFVGTTNDSVYFKGTGNTRFLPVKIITPMDIEYFLTIREQLYAEAMVYYGDNPDQWWRMGEDATTQAETQREQRRQASMIEDDFADWLYRRRFVKHIADAAEFVPEKYRVSMPEIMTGYYGLLAREKWKDPAYERQAKTTLKALEWYPGNKTTFTGPTIGRVKGRPWECNPLAWPAEDGLESS